MANISVSVKKVYGKEGLEAVSCWEQKGQETSLVLMRSCSVGDLDGLQKQGADEILSGAERREADLPPWL